jgi:long-subunit fatty acid transport protein
MIKNFFISVSLLFSLISFAQSGASSPYSFYGIGDVRFRGTVENRSMASLSVLPDSIHLNLQNPAMYSELKLTTFALAGTYTADKLKTQTESSNTKRSTLDYIAVGMPFGKVSVAFGLMPYSSVGYKISKTTNNISSDEYNSSYSSYTGSGGLNKVFVGFAYKINNHFSFGVDFQYNFGKIETISTESIANVQYASEEINYSDQRGFSFNTGLSYKTKLKNKMSLYSSATFSPEASLKLNNTRTLLTISSAQPVVDYYVVPVDNSKIKLPSKVSFGAGIGFDKKWMVGAEVVLQDNSKFGNRFNDINNVTFTNASRFSLGGFYIPKYNSFSSYFSRVVYRAGLRFENTGLVIENTTIKDKAVTFGMGMPLKGTFSNINLGVEYGTRGTTNAGLVQENYFNFSIGLSFSDKWFQKSKYD